MWFWTLNWNEIREDLLIGSCPRKIKDLDRIKKKCSATAIMSLQHDECLANLRIDYAAHLNRGQQLNLEMKRLPMRDFDPTHQRQRLPDAIYTLHDLLSHKHRVYVHCTAGMGRSALTVIGYLTFIERYTLDEAVVLLKKSRPSIIPSRKAYEGCRTDLINRYQQSIMQRAQEIFRRSSKDHTDLDSCTKEAEREVLREVLSQPCHD